MGSQKEKRVIGTLLGQNNDDQIFVTNCFPLIHHEDIEQLIVDEEYAERQTMLYRLMNENEYVVGWYSTGHIIDFNSYKIHNTFLQSCENPLLLLIDTDLTIDRLTFKGYLSKIITLVPEKPLIAQFTEILIKIYASPMEKLGI